jgi:hypothetical protein
MERLKDTPFEITQNHLKKIKSYVASIFRV